MDLAKKIMDKADLEHPEKKKKKLSELEKGRIALEYMAMNMDPHKYGFYNRFFDNKGDVKVEGYNPITGKENNDIAMFQSILSKKS